MALAPNPVLEAFMAGVQQRQEKTRQSQEQQYRYDALERQKEEFEQNHKDLLAQHERDNARQDTLDALNRSIIEYKQQQDEQELFTKSGVTPPGMTKTVPSFSQPYQVQSENTSEATPQSQIVGVPSSTMASIPTDFSGISQGQVGLTDAKGKTINAITPEANAKQQARVLEITQGPLIEKAAKAEEDKHKAEMELERLKISGSTDIEKMKIESERLKEANANSARLGQIALENAGKLAAAKARGSSDKSIQQSLRISNQFDTNDIVKRYTILKDAATFVNDIPNDTKQGSDDQALVYAFAKSMDPSSAVREGEYNTVQKYAQTIADRFKFNIDRINSGTIFLTEKARAEMKKTITQKATSEQKEYDLIRKEYSKKITNLGEDPENWLTQHGAVSSSNDLYFDAQGNQIQKGK